MSLVAMAMTGCALVAGLGTSFSTSSSEADASGDAPDARPDAPDAALPDSADAPDATAPDATDATAPDARDSTVSLDAADASSPDADASSPSPCASAGLCACVDAGGACLLAAGQGYPFNLVVDSTSVYWLNAPDGGEGAVLQCPLAGCGASGPQTIAGQLTGPYGLAVGGGNVYWTEPGAASVDIQPISGGGVSLIDAAQLVPTGITLAATGPMTTTVYWTSNTPDGGIWSASLTDTTAIQLVYGQSSPLGIATDGTSVYWTNNVDGPSGGGVYSAPLGTNPGGNATMLQGSQPFPTAIAVYGGSVYWINAATDAGLGSVQACTLASACMSGGQLAGHLLGPSQIASDGMNVYWTDTPAGTVVKCAVGGCAGAPSNIAIGQQMPWGIAVDGTSVYWTTWIADGGVWKAPK